MKKIVYTLFTLFFLFLVNIVFYYISEDYRFFLQNLKKSDNISIETIIDDDINLDNASPLVDDKNVVIDINPDIISEENNIDDNISEEANTWVIVDVDSTGSIIDIEKELNDIKLEEEEITNIEKELNWDNNSEKLELSMIDNEFLNKFQVYWISESPYLSSLMWLTTEYPEKYIEYSAKNIEVLFFFDNSFQSIYEFFDIISYDLPFELKRVDNFWDKSFYINLDESDWYVRLIIEKNARVFWLKILKSEYNNVKNILNNL